MTPNVLRVYAVPFAAYKQLIFSRGKRHGANSIIPFSTDVSVVNTLVRRRPPLLVVVESRDRALSVISSFFHPLPASVELSSC